MKPRPKIFLKSLFGVLVAIIIGLSYLRVAEQPKSEFNRVDGQVIEIKNTHDYYPRKEPEKFRFLRVDGYPKPFELFIGKGSGDFKPKLEKIDQLKPGDMITVYFDEGTSKDQNHPVSFGAYYIDRGNEAIYIHSPTKVTLLYGLIGFMVIFALVLVGLKVTGKIL